jgi:hypothetical protein
MARLDDDAAEGEHVPATLVGRVDLGRLIVEVNNGYPVLQRGCGFGIDVLAIDAEVVMSGQVPAVGRRIRVLVGRRNVVWVSHVWVHCNSDVKMQDEVR